MHRPAVAETLIRTRTLLRTLIAGVLAFVALGTLSGCSGGSSTKATATDTAAHVSLPESARYMADMEADQSVGLQNGTLVSKINGRNVTGRVVTGNTRFG